MDDHNSFYGIYNSPSIEDLFTASEPQPQPLAPIDAVPLTNNATTSPLPLAGAVPDFNICEDYHALWESLSEAGPSEIQDPDHRPPSQSQNNDNENNRQTVVGDGGGDQNVMRPSFGQVLRQTLHVHFGYNNYMKLEIHGTVGAISHATVETKSNHASTSSGVNSHFEVIDFSSKSAEEVKLFLTNYFSQRNQEGYVVSNDPMLTFYDTLSLGLPSSHKADFVTALPPNNISAAERSDYQNMKLPEQPPQQQQQEHEQERVTKRAGTKKSKLVNPILTLAQQRKKTAKLDLADLRDVFHVNLVEAAKRIRVCATVLKAVCRRHGVPRWPFRKVNSVKKKIAALQKNLNSSDPEVSADAQSKINNLRAEVTAACGGVSIL